MAIFDGFEVRVLWVLWVLSVTLGPFEVRVTCFGILLMFSILWLFSIGLRLGSRTMGFVSYCRPV